jgi:[ribosomal protein S5]-alanine N-acetyltransferase
MKLQGSHIYIRGLELVDAEPLLQLRLRNREFLKPFEPTRSETDFTLKSHQEQIITIIHDRDTDKGYTIGIFLNETNKIIGRVALTGITRGAWQNVNIGYFLAKGQNGKGFSTRIDKRNLLHASSKPAS